MDDSGYPTEEELEAVTKWGIKSFKDCVLLLNYVRDLWIYPEYFISFEHDNHTVFQISTGGWSGHEELIAALEKNYIFWTFSWYSSRRGGHYEFKINYQEILQSQSTPQKVAEEP